MNYNPQTDLLIMAAFLLTLILMALVGARRDRKRKAWMPPAWLGQASSEHYRNVNGYNPAMPANWSPERSTVTRPVEQNERYQQWINGRGGFGK